MAKPLTDKQMRERFGYALDFFKSDASLNRIYEQAKKERWDQTNFQAALRQTTWYKQRTVSQRSFDETYYKDQATYRDNINDRRTALVRQAQAMGVNVADPAFTKWLDGTPAKGKAKAVLGAAANAVRNDANDGEIQGMLASYWYKGYQGNPAANINKNTLTGEAANTASQLRTLAHQYGYPAGDDWLEKNTYSVLNGTSDVRSHQETMRNWASNQYKAVADRIQGGETVDDILDPYRQVAASMLGSDKAAMRPDDPKWTAAISGPEVLTLDDWRVKVRTGKQYGWDTSVNAQGEAYRMAQSLRSIFQGE